MSGEPTKAFGVTVIAEDIAMFAGAFSSICRTDDRELVTLMRDNDPVRQLAAKVSAHHGSWFTVGLELDLS